MKQRAALWVVHRSPVGAMVLLASSSAHAYPWMIRYGYTGCAPCHTDPSGGAGALTEYGRAQSDLLLRMRYAQGAESGEADKTSGFLWGLAPRPRSSGSGATSARGSSATRSRGRRSSRS